MTADDLTRMIDDEIAGKPDGPYSHGVQLSRCIVPPTRIKIIERTVDAGRVRSHVRDAWLVLEEDRNNRDGYKIVFDEKSGLFGLASSGFPSDPYPVLCGLYGGFLCTLECM